MCLVNSNAKLFFVVDSLSMQSPEDGSPVSISVPLDYGWSGVFSADNLAFFWLLYFQLQFSLFKIQIWRKLFLGIALGLQISHNVNQKVSQNSLDLQLQSILKTFYQKNYTIVKPLFNLELRGKILTLPGNLCQIVVKVK